MKLSIIVITCNSRTNLRRTCESIVTQTWRDFEWIVLDMGSSDGSYNFLEDYPCDYLQNIPNHGIVQAMNYALGIAGGEYVLFLNGGDYLLDKGVLECVFTDTAVSGDILYGDAISEQAEGVCKKPTPVRTPGSIDSPLVFRRINLPRQATFIRRSLFDQYGLYDETYSELSDWKQWIHFALKGVSFQKLNLYVCGLEYRGMTARKKNMCEKERRHIERSMFYPLEGSGYPCLELWTCRFLSVPLVKVRITPRKCRHLLFGCIPVYQSDN